VLHAAGLPPLAQPPRTDTFNVNTPPVSKDPVTCFDGVLRDAIDATQAFQIALTTAWRDKPGCRNGAAAAPELDPCWSSLVQARALIDQAAQAYVDARKSGTDPTNRQLVARGNSLMSQAANVLQQARTCFGPIFAKWTQDGGRYVPGPLRGGVSADAGLDPVCGDSLQERRNKDRLLGVAGVVVPEQQMIQLNLQGRVITCGGCPQGPPPPKFVCWLKTSASAGAGTDRPPGRVPTETPSPPVPPGATPVGPDVGIVCPNARSPQEAAAAGCRWIGDKRGYDLCANPNWYTLPQCVAQASRPSPEEPQACALRSPEESYVRGLVEGFASCVVSTITSPLALLSAIDADLADLSDAARAMVRSDADGAARILKLKGERDRQQLEEMARSIREMFNPRVLDHDAFDPSKKGQQPSDERRLAQAADAGRRHGARICQFAVLPEAGRALRVTKPVTPPAIEAPVLKPAYAGPLRLVLPAAVAESFASLVDTIARRAAMRVARDPKFLANLERGELSQAGTRFHAAARREAEALRSQVPEGWVMHAEESTIDAKGDAIRIDLYFRGPCGELIVFDWKTSGRSALAAIEQMDKYMGTLTWQYQWQFPGAKVVTASSVSWIDYVRPLVPQRYFANYKFR
jgi:hypothetical protein